MLKSRKINYLIRFYHILRRYNMSNITHTLAAAALTVVSYQPATFATDTSTTFLNVNPIQCNPVFLKRKDDLIDTDTDIHSTKNVVPTFSKGFSSENSKLSQYEKVYNKQLSHLISSFYNNYEQTSDLNELGYTILFSQFYEMAFKIADLGFDKASVEIVESDSIKFSLKFDDSRVLFITKSIISNIEDANDQITISLFQNKKRLVSDVFQIDQFIEGFKKYLSV